MDGAMDGSVLGASLGAIDLLGTLDGLELVDGEELVLGLPDGVSEGAPDAADGSTDMLGL